jgi:hypothetical protein
MVVLLVWLALGVMAVALLNVAKMLVRSSARRHHVAASTSGQALASVDGRDAAVQPLRSPSQPLRSPSHRHPGTVALPPPQASRRSA